MARSLVTNEQGGPLAQLGIAPRQPLQHRTLGAIVVHTAAVFLCRQRVDILQPFVNMLNNPAALVVSASPSVCEFCWCDYDTMHSYCRMPIYLQCLRISSQKLGEFLEGRFMVMTTSNNVSASLIISWKVLITDVIFSSILKSVQEDIHT